MAISPSSNFTSLVLKEVLDSFPLPGELHFEVIVHFRRDSGDPGCGFPLKRRWGGNLLQAPFRQLVAFPRVALSSIKESSFTASDHGRLKRGVERVCFLIRHKVQAVIGLSVAFFDISVQLRRSAGISPGRVERPRTAVSQSVVKAVPKHIDGEEWALWRTTWILTLCLGKDLFFSFYCMLIFLYIF